MACVDPPPPGLVTSDAPPIDYSKPRTDVGRSADPRARYSDRFAVGREAHRIAARRARRARARQADAPLRRPRSSARVAAVGSVEPRRDRHADSVQSRLSDRRHLLHRDVRVRPQVHLRHARLACRTSSIAATPSTASRSGSRARTTPTRTSRRSATELGPKYRVVDWKELNRSLFSALKLEKIAMFLVLGIVILVASFSIVGNLIMVVVEKQREIALLKTLGASDPGIMQLFAIQGLLIGLIGTLLGVGDRVGRLLRRQADRDPAQPRRLLHRSDAGERRSAVGRADVRRGCRHLDPRDVLPGVPRCARSTCDRNASLGAPVCEGAAHDR